VSYLFIFIKNICNKINYCLSWKYLILFSLNFSNFVDFQPTSQISATSPTFSQLHKFQQLRRLSANFTNFSNFADFQPTSQISATSSTFNQLHKFQQLRRLPANFTNFSNFADYQPTSQISATSPTFCQLHKLYDRRKQWSRALSFMGHPWHQQKRGENKLS
jgi:hypothetical protein